MRLYIQYIQDMNQDLSNEDCLNILQNIDIDNKTRTNILETWIGVQKKLAKKQKWILPSQFVADLPADLDSFQPLAKTMADYQICFLPRDYPPESDESHQSHDGDQDNDGSRDDGNDRNNAVQITMVICNKNSNSKITLEGVPSSMEKIGEVSPIIAKQMKFDILKNCFNHR